MTLKSDSDHGYLMLTDTDSIDAFLFSKLFEKSYLRIIKIELNIFQHFRSLVSCFRYSYYTRNSAYNRRKAANNT